MHIVFMNYTPCRICHSIFAALPNARVGRRNHDMVLTVREFPPDQRGSNVLRSKARMACFQIWSPYDTRSTLHPHAPQMVDGLVDECAAGRSRLQVHGRCNSIDPNFQALSRQLMEKQRPCTCRGPWVSPSGMDLPKVISRNDVK